MVSQGGEHPLCNILISGGVKSPPAKWLRLIAFGFGRYYFVACFQLISGLYPGASWLMAVAPFVAVWGVNHSNELRTAKIIDVCLCVSGARLYVERISG